MRTARIALLLVLTGCTHAQQASHPRELLSFEPSAFQSANKLTASWKALGTDQRDMIQRYLFSLGVSSTGVIQLIGVYGDDASGALLHFQQLDLYGNRLFWSVLVDPDDISARVIYHTHLDRISDKFIPIAATSQR
jgi:hypothetical protein